MNHQAGLDVTHRPRKLGGSMCEKRTCRMLPIRKQPRNELPCLNAVGVIALYC